MANLDGPQALIRSVQEAALLTLRQTREAEAALESDGVEGALAAIRLREQVVEELGALLARLAGLRARSPSDPSPSWDEAAELAWRPVHAVLEELGTADASLTNALRSARDAIAAELSGAASTDELAAAYGTGTEPRRVDRRG